MDTATDMSPTYDTLLFIYTHEEVKKLLDNQQLAAYQRGFEEEHKVGKKTGHREGKEEGYEEGFDEGSRKWGEGYEEGYKTGKELGQEQEEEAKKNGRFEGYELGMQDGKEEERRQWLMEGHGDGLCVSMQQSLTLTISHEDLDKAGA